MVYLKNDLWAKESSWFSWARGCRTVPHRFRSRKALVSSLNQATITTGTTRTRDLAHTR